MSGAAAIQTPVDAPISTPDLTWDNLDSMAPSMPEAKEEVSAAPIIEDNAEVEPETEQKPEVKDTKEPESTSIKDETEIELKIDGKLEKVSLKDLKANYSGKVAYDKKFSEIDKERKTVIKEKTSLQKEVDTINNYVNTFADKMRQKDAVGAMSYLAEFSGMSPAAIKQTLINQLLPEINRQSHLTDAERDLELTKEEIAFQKNLQTRELDKLKAENSQKGMELANAKLRAEKGISESEWGDAFDFLDNHVEPGKPITRNDVAEYALWARADNRTSAVLNQYEGGKYLKDNNVRDTLTKIASENPDFTAEDLNDVLKEAFKGKAEENVKKVAAAKNVQAKPRDDKGKFTYSTAALTSWD